MRAIHLLLAVPVLAAAPAAAQPTIQPGQRVTGELAASDPVEAPPRIVSVPIRLGEPVQGELARGDGKDHGEGYSDTYSYHGRAGETLVITLVSEDFDALLNFGRVELGACRALDSDDDGAGGTDSRLSVTLEEDGEYHVHVGTAQAGRRGRYTLRIDRH